MISNFFSQSFIKKNLIKDNGIDLLFDKIEKYHKVDQRKKLKNIYSEMYLDLLVNYKCEYIYKNELFNLLLDEYHNSKVAFFDEFKVENSIADLVCFNGNITVYEIKTDLDSLDKLEKQIEDYKKIADKIFIVTSPNFLKKIISNEIYNEAGIIILDDKNNLVKYRESNLNTAINKKSLYKLLHKKEVSEIIDYNFNFIPDIPNTIFLKYCFELIEDIDLLKFKNQVISKLKSRKINNHYRFIDFKETPRELNYIFNNLDLNLNDIEIINNNLNLKKICIHHSLEESNLNY